MPLKNSNYLNLKKKEYLINEIFINIIINKKYFTQKEYDTARDYIIINCAHIVNRIASSYSFQYPRFDPQSFRQAGLVGLVKSIEKYNPNRNSKFTSFIFLVIKHNCSNILHRHYASKRTVQMLSLNAPINNDDPNEISIFIEDPKGEELMQQYIAKDTCEQIMTLLPPKEQEWIMELMRSSTAREFAAKKNIPEETCRVRSAKLISKIRELIINKSPIGQNPLMKRLLNKNNKYIYPKYQHNYYKHHRGKWVKNPRKIN